MPAIDHLKSAIERSAREGEQASVELHNAYSWVRPDADACAICGRKAFATPVDGFLVRPCDRCERLVCERDADTDCDSDQDGYFTTSWTCKDTVECQRITDADRELEPPKLEHPPLRSLWEIQAEKYAHCDHEMVRDDTHNLRFSYSRYVCAKGCGLVQDF